MDKLGVLDTELIASKRAVYTLIGIMDFIYSFYAEVNDKRTWMCKSMGMSKFHNELLVYFGVDRLRYIYLVRDPRDVAMSFMKTPVGDCHYYAIVTKWCRLQDQVLPILRDTPDLILLVRYESLLVNKEKVVEEICEFIGKRRFGKTMRLGSVLAAASRSSSRHLADPRSSVSPSLNSPHTLHPTTPLTPSIPPLPSPSTHPLPYTCCAAHSSSVEPPSALRQPRRRLSRISSRT